MRLQLMTIFILSFGYSFGQVFSYPAVNTNGQGFADFIPNGWTVLDSAKGDMNKDGKDDLALVVQFRDSALIAKVEYDDLDTVFTQPRMLLLAFYNVISKRYELVERSNTFILTHDQDNMEEPFQDISISKGVLKIGFNIFMNSGGWGTFSNIYKFIYQDKEFRLIGAEYNYLNRGSGETEERSYNFLKNKVKLSTGTISSDIMKTKWHNLKVYELKTLKTFSQPFTWKMEKYFYL
jgi:hypothetical protein